MQSWRPYAACCRLLLKLCSFKSSPSPVTVCHEGLGLQSACGKQHFLKKIIHPIQRRCFLQFAHHSCSSCCCPDLPSPCFPPGWRRGWDLLDSVHHSCIAGDGKDHRGKFLQLLLFRLCLSCWLLEKFSYFCPCSPNKLKEDRMISLSLPI